MKQLTGARTVKMTFREMLLNMYRK